MVDKLFKGLAVMRAPLFVFQSQVANCKLQKGCELRANITQ